jgi:hypothetical protein
LESATGTTASLLVELVADALVSVAPASGARVTPERALVCTAEDVRAASAGAGTATASSRPTSGKRRDIGRG